MKISYALSVASVLAASVVAQADPILQFDVNSFNVQTTNTAGIGSAFGGLSHTGSVNFSMGSFSVLNGMFANTPSGGPLVNLGFNGTLSNFTGQVTLVNGQVTGGSLTIAVNGGTDTYTTNVVASGQVESYIGGGFKIEGLSAGGGFSDAAFGNVDVSSWFNAALFGSFLQFNWIPDGNGAGFGDMDIFVDVVPLPPAAWGGLAMLGLVAVVRKARRR
jgi:hypothetical protein